ncbi:hypothetical protein M409DRAFT_29852 [Zasmidium cellare ATCC 36951]|uniref:Uncharacterized protein n=1 Tax=Zasmidium cellare ATCC 36951 TaxID=1080233 RepID=A0A6A6C0K6_ZASCE|nr:uncharacterized protein M409DRAFT_29852 [Zasmidium cellare ATCC 36951]KAF2159690.1 hypothetical protein M409DRAFT_29852 [Zasmidium cellare ATCC 36951]
MDPSQYYNNYMRDREANLRKESAQLEDCYGQYLDIRTAKLREQKEIWEVLDKVTGERLGVGEQLEGALMEQNECLQRQHLELLELRAQLRLGSGSWPASPGLMRRIGRQVLVGFLLLSLVYTLMMLNVMLIGALAAAWHILTPSWWVVDPYPPIDSVLWAVLFVCHRRSRLVVFVAFGIALLVLISAGMVWQVMEVVRS